MLYVFQNGNSNVTVETVMNLPSAPVPYLAAYASRSPAPVLKQEPAPVNQAPDVTKQDDFDDFQDFQFVSSKPINQNTPAPNTVAASAQWALPATVPSVAKTNTKMPSIPSPSPMHQSPFNLFPNGDIPAPATQQESIKSAPNALLSFNLISLPEVKPPSSSNSPVAVATFTDATSKISSDVFGLAPSSQASILKPKTTTFPAFSNPQHTSDIEDILEASNTSYAIEPICNVSPIPDLSHVSEDRYAAFSGAFNDQKDSGILQAADSSPQPINFASFPDVPQPQEDGLQTFQSGNLNALTKGSVSPATNTATPSNIGGTQDNSVLRPNSINVLKDTNCTAFSSPKQDSLISKSAPKSEKQDESSSMIRLKPVAFLATNTSAAESSPVLTSDISMNNMVSNDGNALGSSNILRMPMPLSRANPTKNDLLKNAVANAASKSCQSPPNSDTVSVKSLDFNISQSILQQSIGNIPTPTSETVEATTTRKKFGPSFCDDDYDIAGIETPPDMVR